VNFYFRKRGIPEDIKKDASKIRQTLNECKMPLSDRWNVADNSTRGTSSVMERSKNTNGVQTVFCINYDVLQQVHMLLLINLNLKIEVLYR